MTAESVVNKLSMFVVCMTNCAVGYRLNDKREFSDANFEIAWKTLLTFQLNASLFIRAKVMKTDDECNIHLKCQ